MIPRKRDQCGLASKCFKKEKGTFFLVHKMTRGPVTFGLCRQLLSIYNYEYMIRYFPMGCPNISLFLTEGSSRHSMEAQGQDGEALHADRAEGFQAFELGLGGPE